MTFRASAAAAAMLLLLTPLAHAQERTASGSLESQINWSALTKKIDTLNAQYQALSFTVTKLLTCNNARKVYAPTESGADADGCVTPVQGGQ